MHTHKLSGSYLIPGNVTSSWTREQEKQPSIHWLLLVLTCLITSLGATAHAIGILVPRVPEFSPVHLSDIEVKAEIRNNVARTRVVQDFYNPNPRQLEADFYFPVPRGADVTDFVLYMNGKPVKGEVLEKEKAREIYENIVRQMKDPGLLEWMDHNLFKVRVFPVPASGTQRIELEFAQPLSADQGVFKYTFPMKSTKGTVERPGHSAKAEFALNIISDEPVRNVFSPSHTADIDSHDPKSVKVTIPKWSLTNGSGDFVLFYELTSKEIALSLLTHRESGDDGFFSLMISPPAQHDKHKPLPNDVVLVIDSSGSMLQDNKIEQAKNALTYCVSQLKPEDRFNLIRFSTEVEKFKESLLTVSKDNIEQAKRWISELPARGGTNISGALEEALNLREKETGSTTGTQRVYTIVFITDGQPTVGTVNREEIVKLVRSRNSANIRTFTFGVGNDVNAKLLDRIADETRAVSDYIRPGQDMEVIIGKFFDKISQPAMTGLKLEIPSAEVYDIYPKVMPDLFFGTQLTVFGRYKKSGPSAIKLTGNVAGETVEHVFEKTLPEKDEESEFVEKLWGTRKIAYLLDEIRDKGENAELKDEVIRLAKKYAVATPYTSFLVTEDTPMIPSSTPVASGPSVRPSQPQRSVRFYTQDQGMVGERQKFSRSQAMAKSEPQMAGAPLGAVSADAAPPASQPARPAPHFDTNYSMSEQSGEKAVAMSSRLREMKDSTRVDTPGTVKTIAGKTFSNQAGVWVDDSIQENTPVLKVKYLSAAYFEIIRRKPIFKDVFALGSLVKVSLGSVVLEVSTEGKEELTDEEWSSLKLDSADF